MKNSRRHPFVVFDTETLRAAIQVLLNEAQDKYGNDAVHEFGLMSVRSGLEGWQLDTIDELLALLAEQVVSPHFNYGGFDLNVSSKGRADTRANLDFTQYSDHAVVEVTHADRAVIARVHEVFASAAPRLYSPPPIEAEPPAPAPRIFIGHGGTSKAWVDLKNHLSDKHQFEVIAYESGARTGHTIRDILEEMLGEANFAILVMTAEDLVVDPEDEEARGAWRARQNVIHEAGLFQGRLGFARAIMVLQEGVEMLSNLDGVQHLPFKHGINETFGDVVAVLRREFG